MPAANARMCMSTHFSSDECPWAPESQENHTEDLPGNGVTYKCNVEGLWGQFPPVVPLTQYNHLLLHQVKALRIEAMNGDRNKFLVNAHKTHHHILSEGY